ncbi:hypothetical protein B0H16DRAFT_1308431 [Mycena metata]|uniref:Nephrocystin 3-like N-terminal domain-containing protein n=1 Tax=Mycena metata TaxID=1033252 RepID=A0AAD7NMU5_9AGAR|nr:hypothetical protein B0H16DRAFT_1308431 [Mycena metata]
MARSHPAAERNKIAEWLSPLNSFQRQLDILSTSQPGTGRWLLAHTLFKKWENDCGQTLWGRGIPGAGKTVLISLVIHHLEARNDDIGIAWIYLNHKESDIQTPVNILGSFLKQLTTHGSRPIPATLQTLYQHHRERKTRPTPEEMLEAFPSIITGYSKVYLIIDAFDEYPEHQRHLL